jgi:DNA polymerase III alpha subunit
VRINNFGQVIINEDEAIEALYTKKIDSLDNVYLDSDSAIEQFNHARQINADTFANLIKLLEPTISIEEFDKTNQDYWFMPEEYKNYDIAGWLYTQCQTVEQKDRVTNELELFVQHNMITLLKYLKYLVDTMRDNNIVWGVGRGSSVASYVLYLIGVHKIDSIKYNLDIKEFLK